MKNEKLQTFLKGLAMGTCDVIPGISGGTIAFITGIYTRLIDGIKQYTPKNAQRLFFGNSKERRKVADALDFWFFIPAMNNNGSVGWFCPGTKK